ncbi:hypothetical protein B7494_g7228 [Chlorociboria aeruginascens]|nr:hypothetical protein B7494_g7228 [Chlorociboria aeruginascens]
MKTTKHLPSDLSSSRRAQPIRQTRTHPPKSGVPGSRTFGRTSLPSGLDSASSPVEPVKIFPAITAFSDAIRALPKELVRHFTLLKEVDAKTFAAEDHLGELVHAALNAPLPERRQPPELHHALGPTSAPMSAQPSINGSVTNGHIGSVPSVGDVVDAYNPANANFDIPRRQIFQQISYTIGTILISTDEKNHVLSTANESLNKQVARLEDCWAHFDDEFDAEARYGSSTHWAYPENRSGRSGHTGHSRALANPNTQLLVDEAAARSDARKQAVLAKKAKNHHVESDFDDHHDGRNKVESTKKLHGNSKIRKAADAAIGLGITNGTGTNGNPPHKRRKIDKGANGVGMERAMTSVYGSNGTAAKGKGGSPRETPGPDGPKKRPRGGAATNGQTRKRNNTVNSVAMSPSLASSPIRTTFPDAKANPRSSPPATNGGRLASSRARQNSTQSIVETARQRPESSASNKPNGVIGTPDLGVAASITGRTIPEVKSTMKESGTSSKDEHLLEDVEQQPPEMVGGLVVGNRRDSTAKREDTETNGDVILAIQTSTVVMTKSGRASKPSTPAIPQFPEPGRSRSARNHNDTSSNGKRSHKKGAGAAAQLLAKRESDDVTLQGDDEDLEVDADEPTYCYCNGVSYGEMVACDADGCEKEWFHLECVGLKVAPRGNAKWYCDDCKDKLKSKRFNGR